MQNHNIAEIRRANEILSEAGFKVSYGSDYPYIDRQVLTKGLQRMRQYLTEEHDLAPYKDLILYKNAEWLLGRSDKPYKTVR